VAGYGAFLNGLLVNNDTINNTAPDKVDQKLLDTLGVTAVDDFTVQFKLVHPAGYFNQVAALWLASPVRKDNVERAGLPDPTGWTDPANGPMVGTGPYILTKWDHNKEMVFSKNPNYSGTPANIDEIDLPIIQDTAIAYAGYKSGALDVTLFPGAEIPNVKADPVLSKQLLQYPSACEIYINFDNTKPPFDDEKVREAFTYALNRDLYIHVITQDTYTKFLSFMPKDVAGDSFDPALGQAYDYNPDKAKAALAASKYPDASTFPAVNFNYAAGADGQRRADFLQAQIQQILGINITENPMDNAAYQAATTDPINKLSGFWRAGWCADYLHPSDWLYPVFGSNGKAGNANNQAGFNSKEFDDAAQKADNETDPVKAAQLYKAAQKILVDSFPVAFLGANLNLDLVSSRVKNLTPLANSLDGGLPGSFFWEEIDVAN
jgi:oligopeptide transport system substrate-binding protein